MGVNRFSPGCGCCGCVVYFFDEEEEVNESHWTVEDGSATFSSNRITLDASSRISLNSPVLRANNYAARVSLLNGSGNYRVYMDGVHFTTEVDSFDGDWVITLSNGAGTETRSGSTDGGAANPSLAICLRDDQLTGWSHRVGSCVGHLAMSYSGTLNGKLEIENLGTDSIKITKVELLKAETGEGYDAEDCLDCEPIICTDCNDGWMPSDVDIQINGTSVTSDGAGTCCSWAYGEFPGPDTSYGDGTLISSEEEWLLWILTDTDTSTTEAVVRRYEPEDVPLARFTDFHLFYQHTVSDCYDSRSVAIGDMTVTDTDGSAGYTSLTSEAQSAAITESPST